MITACDKPDILDTIKGSGIELKQRGRYHWGLCPFHSERTPSFKVDTERQSFYCFGCHTHGDSISFVQRLRSLSFSDTLNYFGINPGKPSLEALQHMRLKKRKAELVRKFRQWGFDYHNDLCDLYRSLQIAKGKVKTIEDAETLSWAYHLEPIWIHKLDILESRDDKAKFEIYTEAHGNGN